eukprot:969386_1
MAANPEMDLELKLPYDDVHLDEKTEKSILESIGPAGAQFKDGPIELSRFLMFCGLSASDVKLVWKENCRIPGSVTQKLINEGGIPKIIAVMKSHFLRLQKFGESKGFFVMLHVINQLQEYGHVFRRILGRSKEPTIQRLSSLTSGFRIERGEPRISQPERERLRCPHRDDIGLGQIERFGERRELGWRIAQSVKHQENIIVETV